MYQRPNIEQIYCYDENLIQSIDNEKLDKNKLNLYANIFVEKNQIDKKWNMITEIDINYMIDKFIENNQYVATETELFIDNQKRIQRVRPYIWTFQILDKNDTGLSVPNLKGMVRRYIEVDGQYILDKENENYHMMCLAIYETDTEVSELLKLNKEQIHKIHYSWRIHVNEQTFLRIILRPVLGYYLYQLV